MKKDGKVGKDETISKKYSELNKLLSSHSITSSNNNTKLNPNPIVTINHPSNYSSGSSG
jgi:hypothetical protein